MTILWCKNPVLILTWAAVANKPDMSILRAMPKLTEKSADVCFSVCYAVINNTPGGRAGAIRKKAKKTLDLDAKRCVARQGRKGRSYRVIAR